MYAYVFNIGDQRLRGVAFERAASYAADCERHVYFALAAADEDALAERSSETRPKLEALAARMDGIIDEISEIRGALVELRFLVQDKLSPEVAHGLSVLDGLDRQLSGFAPRAALLIRATRVRQRFPEQLAQANPAAAKIFDAVTAVHVAASLDEGTARAVTSAIAAIEALHDGVSPEEALATERERWE